MWEGAGAAVSAAPVVAAHFASTLGDALPVGHAGVVGLGGNPFAKDVLSHGGTVNHRDGILYA